MPRLRTTLALVAAGGAVVATGVVATTATAAPAPVAAVDAVTGQDVALTSDDTDASTDADAPAGRWKVRHGVRQWWKDLSDEQQQCLKDADVTRPVGPLDDAERQALRDEVTAAATACGVELPYPKARQFWNDLSAEQKQCLDEQKVTRPWGPLTKEQRQQVRQDLREAADTCGVELPERTKAGASAS